MLASSTVSCTTSAVEPSIAVAGDGALPQDVPDTTFITPQEGYQVQPMM